jgi:decaprenylphospho-beta-D-ribofuranose 2-oxidase
MARISGWGNYPVVEAKPYALRNIGKLRAYLESDASLKIARGLGRSYGDSSLSEAVVLTRSYACITGFDDARGVVQCEAGISLAELIEVFLPRGWFLKATPGTRQITVGGAIASDVHGKNHHSAGCFSESVLSFELMLADGTIIRCSKNENPELFRATCGGMGLTGIILQATLQLQRVNSNRIRQITIKARNLEEIFYAFSEYASWPYSVAWIDCLASGENLGRSLLMVGHHEREGRLRVESKKPLSLPVHFPSWWLNRYSISLFNYMYYTKQRKSPKESTVGFDAFFYPLDAVSNWNLMYGRNGFTQYQCVLPLAASQDGLLAVLERISRSGMGSFLAVLKLFGEANENYLSFPMEGYTLALDFKLQNGVFALLDELDRIVLDHGGRLYLAKDVRMPAAMMRSGYPKLEQFADIRERYGMKRIFHSLQSRRLEI